MSATLMIHHIKNIEADILPTGNARVKLVDGCGVEVDLFLGDLGTARAVAKALTDRIDSLATEPQTLDNVRLVLAGVQPG